ncbi:MAG: GAF domain-containing protein, partial [bacterium]
MKEFEREGVNPNFEIKSSYDKILDYVQEIISYDFAVLYRVNEKTEKLEVVAKRGDAVELLEEIKFRFGEGLSAWVAEWKKPILLTKKKDDDSGICVGSFLSFPLWAYGKLIGVMSLGHRKPSGFGLKELKLCRLFSERIA